MYRHIFTFNVRSIHQFYTNHDQVEEAISENPPVVEQPESKEESTSPSEEQQSVESPPVSAEEEKLAPAEPEPEPEAVVSPVFIHIKSYTKFYDVNYY
ncbi:uncharacterized protein LY89DRAFT_217869 [Mollisia scopiformis]|uniref:Uncharacterized protein n=1 Tax=Mollisia scopiformis TaxID=149040 RepID=A0A194WVJ0_MOLSC|nr:uncharacterized protein LY89DRAFT_217869 [Mollisia scopiformis]KUJ11976.1 hypothetical protein LY89DRAFT_217869 [Mollisia scopiformis]